MEGEDILFHPSNVLIERGPVLQVRVGLYENIASRLIKLGKRVPALVTGYALVDTGANNTCIDDNIARKLGLPVTDKEKLVSASQGPTDANVYPVFIEFIGFPIKINTARVTGVNLQNQGLIVLLGRDLLQKFILFYNGPEGQITISI